MKLKVKRLSDKAVLPKYALEGDAGMDLVATSREIVDNGDHGYVEYLTDLAFEIPEGYYGDVRPRSSISKTGMILANSPCTIDSNFRGNFSVRFKWIPKTKMYEVGDRICQLVVLPYPHIEIEDAAELSVTNRGEGGYGSTGS